MFEGGWGFGYGAASPIRVPWGLRRPPGFLSQGHRGLGSGGVVPPQNLIRELASACHGRGPVRVSHLGLPQTPVGLEVQGAPSPGNMNAPRLRDGAWGKPRPWFRAEDRSRGSQIGDKNTRTGVVAHAARKHHRDAMGSAKDHREATLNPGQWQETI